MQKMWLYLFSRNYSISFIMQAFFRQFGANRLLYPFLRKETMIIQTTIGESLYLVSLARFSLLF